MPIVKLDERAIAFAAPSESSEPCRNWKKRRMPMLVSNSMGVVTSDRMAREHYYFELEAGLPMGPHVFARDR